MHRQVIKDLEYANIRADKEIQENLDKISTCKAQIENHQIQIDYLRQGISERTAAIKALEESQ